MAVIHIYNCTPQARNFNYRLDILPRGIVATRGDIARIRKLELGPRRGGVIECEQVMVPEVVEQLRRFGYISEDDVAKGRIASFSPGVFREGSAPSGRATQQVIEWNRGVKWEEGKERRRNAAVFANEQIIQQLTATGQDPNSLPTEMRVGFEQDAETETEDSGRIEEGFTIETPPPNSDAGRAKAAKRASGRATRAG